MQQCTKQMPSVVPPFRVLQYFPTYVHGASGDQASLEELVGVLPHDLTVLAGSGLTLVSIDDEVAGTGVEGVGKRARW